MRLNIMPHIQEVLNHSLLSEGNSGGNICFATGARALTHVVRVVPWEGLHTHTILCLRIYPTDAFAHSPYQGHITRLARLLGHKVAQH